MIDCLRIEKIRIYLNWERPRVTCPLGAGITLRIPNPVLPLISRISIYQFLYSTATGKDFYLLHREWCWWISGSLSRRVYDTHRVKIQVHLCKHKQKIIDGLSYFFGENHNLWWARNRKSLRGEHSIFGLWSEILAVSDFIRVSCFRLICRLFMDLIPMKFVDLVGFIFKWNLYTTCFLVRWWIPWLNFSIQLWLLFHWWVWVRFARTNSVMLCNVMFFILITAILFVQSSDNFKSNDDPVNDLEINNLDEVFTNEKSAYISDSDKSLADKSLDVCDSDSYDKGERACSVGTQGTEESGKKKYYFRPEPPGEDHTAHPAILSQSKVKDPPDFACSLFWKRPVYVTCSGPEVYSSDSKRYDSYFVLNCVPGKQFKHYWRPSRLINDR